MEVMVDERTCKILLGWSIIGGMARSIERG
jgi:hypothetical protein